MGIQDLNLYTMNKIEELLSKLPTYTNEGSYGKEYVIQVMKEYAMFCCEEQKKLCIQHVETEFQPMGWLAEQHQIHAFLKGVDYDVYVDIVSILECPTYKEEDGK